MRRFVWLAIATVVVGATCWTFGFDIPASIAVACAVAAAGATWLSFPDRRPTMNWPIGPAQTIDGARRETAQLSWSLTAPSGLSSQVVVSELVVHRIRVLAEHRLAARQLDLDNPRHADAISRLLGRDTFEVVRRERSRPATLGEVLRSLDVIDSLGTRR